MEKEIRKWKILKLLSTDQAICRLELQQASVRSHIMEAEKLKLIFVELVVNAFSYPGRIELFLPYLGLYSLPWLAQPFQTITVGLSTV